MIRAAMLLAALAVPAAAQAGVLDRVKAANTLRCGAAERPGFADAGEDGHVAWWEWTRGREPGRSRGPRCQSEPRGRKGAEEIHGMVWLQGA